MSYSGPIICIEDDEDDQHLIRVAIQDLQVANELCFFSQGEPALQFLKTTLLKPFLILCDINLAGMSGIEFRKCLNENEYLRQKSIPFLFITTAASPALVNLAYDQTVQGFFRKANSYAELKEQLTLILTYWTKCLHPSSEV